MVIYIEINIMLLLKELFKVSVKADDIDNFKPNQNETGNASGNAQIYKWSNLER